ncbi:hypothetical protein HFU84_06375 [Acidithiobacillus sp. CV18-2]|uniref:Uncharacterized protein n=1 Tax=Igneacidithiobacillus copahuensis TaxID=2724909 RepID=A0AAE2YP24_9PROT|nr:hypothetical protein [Igneacidithiobacillus copahuensis]MBU2754423.1 hypothetical protein [Acidithiobacillus sp. CV18-3]MBU2757554.1 hypothetical protein [Acidithiobacillus sp. BN09-2]MBU2777131.1 hypothetical protein [Acidithiobacillus sp. CV18-2]MBU2797444.1 hypothetical protein [Acidithiobacillus sp. VAN18-2]MBU2799718.1 hypothetical protein [Acidithiobacillus sp. VAN18-4]UTV81885.1 hypothetical protein MQE22_04475 [Acidithiobacillus sp. YTS05]
MTPEQLTRQQERVMEVVNASFRARQDIDRALREIDRRALNAMVLVKKHGNALAGYGVVAQAFRERAALLRESASHLQENIAPLIEAQMRILQQQRLLQNFAQVENSGGTNLQAQCAGLLTTRRAWDKAIAAEQENARKILRQLLEEVRILQEGVEEQEYVVTSGRIEAALVEASGVPLMRVSRDMGEAVRIVARAVRDYRQQLERLQDESY